MSHDQARNGVELIVKRGAVLALTLVAVAAVSGCSRDIELKRPPGANSSSHVSPTPPVVAHLPAGTFDQARSHGELLKAQALRLSGDAVGARSAAEAAVSDWPGDAAAWEELAADCRAGGDEMGARYADFFEAKIDFVTTLPPRVAVLGFATLADGSVGTRTGDYVYDRRTLDMAARIASFYDQRDTVDAYRIPPKKVTPPKP